MTSSFCGRYITCYEGHVPLDVEAHAALRRGEQALAPAVDLERQPYIDDPALPSHAAAQAITPTELTGQPACSRVGTATTTTSIKARGTRLLKKVEMTH